MKKFQLLALAMLSVFASNAKVNQQTPINSPEENVYNAPTTAVEQGIIVVDKR